MCAMEARLNIDFGHAIGETKGEKRREPKGGEALLGASANFGNSATGSLSCSLLFQQAEFYGNQ